LKFSCQIFALLLLLLHCNVNAHPAKEHDLQFKQLATVWDEGIPLGNGMVGAIVWQKDGQLRFALDRSDLWDERPMKGLHRKEFSYQWVTEQVKQNNYAVVQQYFDAPYDREAGPSKISGGALEFESKEWGDVTSVHLSLQNALCTVTWNKGIVLKTFVQATKPVGWFRFENINGDFEPSLKSPGYENKSGKPLDSLKSNDPAKLGYDKGTIVKTGNRISYHQPGYNGFYYDIVVEWKRINSNTIEGVWVVSSNYNKENSNAIQSAQQALLRGYKTDLNTHVSWLKNFWNKSSVQLPDSSLERQWYLDQYKFGSAARKGAPPILLQGVWTADNRKLPPWKGDYHHDLNTEMSYWPAYSANHLDEAMAFIDHLEKNKPNYKRYTQLYFNVKGINVPGVTTLAGTEMGGWIQYALSPTVSAWLAQHYYQQWKYSMDAALLKNKTYPWFKEVATYLENITTKDADGFRFLPASSSPEINNNAVNAWFSQLTNYDLSLIRFVFQAAGEMAAYQNLKSDEIHFKKLLSECRQLAVSPNNELMYAPGVAYKESHRHFSHAMAIYPLGLIKWEDGQQSQSVIKNSIALLDSVGPSGWNGYSYSWLACLDARAKNGEAAAKALKIFASAFCSVNSFHVNGDQTKSGYSSRNYRPFTLEGNFGAAAALQEMLLQSHAGFIEVFPAIPASWKNVSFTTLRAEGAFLVSAKKQNGNVSEIKIVSERGGVAKLKLPFINYKILQAKGITVTEAGEGLVQLNCRINGMILFKCENVEM
jgi:hypothetical protein